MTERYHATIKIEGWRIKTGVDMDTLIHDTLADMVKLHGTGLHLVDFKVYELETKPLPPHRDTFLTVIAEEVSQRAAINVIEVHPQDSKKPITKETDLAETIIEWARLTRSEIQDTETHDGIFKLLAEFLTDIENLGHEYLTDDLGISSFKESIPALAKIAGMLEKAHSELPASALTVSEFNTLGRLTDELRRASSELMRINQAIQLGERQL